MTDYVGFRIDARPCEIEQTGEAEGRWHNEVDQISVIVKNVLGSYERHGGINYAGVTNLPSQQHIVHISQTLQMILFPGYYDTGAVEEAALPYVTGERVAWVYKHLSQEIHRCMCFECDQCGESVSHCALRAREAAMKLLCEIPNTRAMLQLDVEAAMAGDPAANSENEVILAYPSLAAISVLDNPSAAAKTMRQRNANACELFGRRAHRSRRSRRR